MKKLLININTYIGNLEARITSIEEQKISMKEEMSAVVIELCTIGVVLTELRTFVESVRK